jgi:hypothetical protein
MKSARAVVPLLVCLLLAQATEAAGRKPQARVTDTKQEVIKFERGWWEAFKMRDKAALERMLADEFHGFDNDAGNEEPVDRRLCDGQQLSRRFIFDRAD